MCECVSVCAFGVITCGRHWQIRVNSPSLFCVMKLPPSRALWHAMGTMPARRDRPAASGNQFYHKITLRNLKINYSSARLKYAIECESNANDSVIDQK